MPPPGRRRGRRCRGRPAGRIRACRRSASRPAAPGTGRSGTATATSADAGDPQAVKRARDPARPAAPAGTPPAACGALSQFSSVTHSGLAAARQRSCPCARARASSAVILAASEIATSSEDAAGRSGFADRQRVEREHVEVRRLPARAPHGRRAARRGTAARAGTSPAPSRPTPAGSPFGRHAGGDDRSPAATDFTPA